MLCALNLLTEGHWRKEVCTHLIKQPQSQTLAVSFIHYRLQITDYFICSNSSSDVSQVSLVTDQSDQFNDT